MFSLLYEVTKYQSSKKDWLDKQKLRIIVVALLIKTYKTETRSVSFIKLAGLYTVTKSDANFSIWIIICGMRVKLNRFALHSLTKAKAVRA